MATVVGAQHAAPRTRPAPAWGTQVPVAPPGHVVPYEYAATFDLEGKPGRIVQDAISISPDGIFVAVAIGYGFQKKRGRPLVLNVADQSGRGTLPAPPAGTVQPGWITL